MKLVSATLSTKLSSGPNSISGIRGRFTQLLSVSDSEQSAMMGPAVDQSILQIDISNPGRSHSHTGAMTRSFCLWLQEYTSI